MHLEEIVTTADIVSFDANKGYCSLLNLSDRSMSAWDNDDVSERWMALYVGCRFRILAE
jgi:hypothetical protein